MPRAPWTLEQCVDRAEAKNLSIRMAAYDKDFAEVGEWGPNGASCRT
ncbi:MAG: hypothetical protein R2815_11960 [Flavobacteriales bacterium]